MPPNVLQEELFEQLKSAVFGGDILVSHDADKYFDGIWQNFPFLGSKIKWSEVPTAVVQKINNQNYHASILDFYDEVIKVANVSSNSKVTVVGDSAIDVALTFTTFTLRQHLVSIVELPQHTYIVPDDFSWCLCYAMEGYITFGFSPGKR